jgi:hypothetical protein
MIFNQFFEKKSKILIFFEYLINKRGRNKTLILLPAFPNHYPGNSHAAYDFGMNM